METQMAYCSACDQQVRIAVTPTPIHGGQAPLPDSPDVVCLDFGHHCTGELCPMFGLPRILMGVRLARSDLRPDGWETVDAPCEGCGRVTTMNVIDPSTAYCSICGGTSRWVLIRVEDGHYIAAGSAPE